MLQTYIHRIKPGAEQRLRAWLEQLNARAEEVRESFAEGGIRAEQAFVIPGETGPLLIYVTEAEDQGRAALAFAGSSHRIDVEHRREMEACIESTLNEAPAYDVSGY